MRPDPVAALNLPVQAKTDMNAQADSRLPPAKGEAVTGQGRQPNGPASVRGNLRGEGQGSGEAPLAMFELDVTSKELAALVKNLRNRLEHRWLSLPLPVSGPAWFPPLHAVPLEAWIQGNGYEARRFIATDSASGFFQVREEPDTNPRPCEKSEGSGH